MSVPKSFTSAGRSTTNPQPQSGSDELTNVPKSLAAYLNEFQFRFNRRTRIAASFHALLGLGAGQRGPTYLELYRVGEAGGWVHPNGLGSPAKTG